MAKPDPRRINLALQGGGAHGAYTWGVLARLLEEEWLEIAAISATSAGALNAAALKAGWHKEGRQGAIDSLAWLWDEIAGAGVRQWGPWVGPPGAGMIAEWLAASPAWMMMDAATRNLSPYALGPLYTNPLAEIVDKLDFGAVCRGQGPELFICATNVRSGKIKVFSGDEISHAAVLASACLPTLFKAIEIDSEAYWDGGYSGNPALWPLYPPRLPDDIVIVNINPLHREELPLDPMSIQNRINEVSFNASLLSELRAIDFVKRLIGQGQVPRGQMKDVQVHMISDDGLMNRLNVATKTLPVPAVISTLYEAGRASAEIFLQGDATRIGEDSTVDLPTVLR